MKSIRKNAAVYIVIVICVGILFLGSCTGSNTVTNEATNLPSTMPPIAEDTVSEKHDVMDIKQYLPDDGMRIEINEPSHNTTESNIYLKEENSGWIYTYIDNAEISPTTFGEFYDSISNRTIIIGRGQMVFEGSNERYYLILHEMDFAKPNPKDNPYFYIAEVVPGKSDDVESAFMYYGNGLDYYIDFDSDNILDTPMIRFQSLDLAYTFGELFYSSRSYTPNLQEVTLLSYYIQGVIEGDVTIGSMLDNFDMYYREETDAMNGNGFAYGNHTYYFELRLGSDEEDRPIDYNIDVLILVHHYAYEDKVIINPTAQEMIAFFNGEIDGESHERYDG